jgi:hypothetical protein
MPSFLHRGLMIGTTALVLALATLIGAASWRNDGLSLFAGVPIADGKTPVTVTVGGEPLTVQADRLRFADQRRPGDYPRIELELKWPGLHALDPDDPALKTTARDGQLVFISIEPRDTDLDTADRIATIYQKFLQTADGVDSSTSDGPGGLIRRPFLAGTAYDGEELYFEPGAVHPFAARCFPADKGQPLISCLRDVRLGKHLLATIRFPVAALADWRALRDRADSIFQEMSGGSNG